MLEDRGGEVIYHYYQPRQFQPWLLPRVKEGMLKEINILTGRIFPGNQF